MTRFIDQNYQGSGELSAAYPVWSQSSGSPRQLVKSAAGLILSGSAIGAETNYDSTIEWPQEKATLEILIDFTNAPVGVSDGTNPYWRIRLVNPSFGPFSRIDIGLNSGVPYIDCGRGQTTITVPAGLQKIRYVVNPPSYAVSAYLGGYSDDQVPVTLGGGLGVPDPPQLLSLAASDDMVAQMPLVSLIGYPGDYESSPAQRFWTATTGCTEVLP